MTDHDDDSTLSEVERLLRALPLRPPTTALDDRIAASLARRPWHPIRWAAVAAVLLAAVLVFHRTNGGRPAPIAQGLPRPSPVSVERIVSQTFDDGVVAIDGHMPYRQVRHQTVREIWWTDPATGARLWAQLPDEHVTVEPAETF